jgi:hypothetical protein
MIDWGHLAAGAFGGISGAGVVCAGFLRYLAARHSRAAINETNAVNREMGAIGRASTAETNAVTREANLLAAMKSFQETTSDELEKCRALHRQCEDQLREVLEKLWRQAARIARIERATGLPDGGLSADDEGAGTT